jgi:hypothetical protein
MSDTQRDRELFNEAFTEHWKLYESVLSDKNERKTRANYSKRELYGTHRGDRIAYTQRHVLRNHGYSDNELSHVLAWLIGYDRLELTSEALVLRFPRLFSDGVVEAATQTMERLKALAGRPKRV